MMSLRKKLLGELLCPLDGKEIEHRELTCSGCGLLRIRRGLRTCGETGFRVTPRVKRPEAECPRGLWQSKGTPKRSAAVSVINGKPVSIFTAGFGMCNLPANLLREQVKRFYDAELNILTEMTPAVALHQDFAFFYAFDLTDADDVIWIDPGVFLFEQIPLSTGKELSVHLLPAPFERYYRGLFSANRKLSPLFDAAKDEDDPELGWQTITGKADKAELHGLFFPLREPSSHRVPPAVALEIDPESRNRLLRQMHASPKPWREVCRHFGWMKELSATDPYPAGTSIAFDCGHAGIGDLLDIAHVAEGLKAENPDVAVSVYTKHQKKSFVDLYGLSGPIPHGAIRHKLPPSPWHKLDNPSRIENWARYCGVSKPMVATPLIGDAAEDFAAGFLKGLPSPIVCLSPISTCQARSWPLERYEALGVLLEGAGAGIVMIDEPEGSRTRESRFPRLFGVGAEREAAVIRRSGLLAGNDSGMAHLSSGLGIPTLVLCGPTDGKSVFGWYAKTSWIDGPLPCRGCYWFEKNGWRKECDHGCMAIMSISVKEVFRKSLDLLDAFTVVSGPS
jgi:hypothetical protein